jgi:hypothetical protein
MGHKKKVICKANGLNEFDLRHATFSLKAPTGTFGPNKTPHNMFMLDGGIACPLP